MAKVLYTVWFEVDSASESDWEGWMKEKHIPAVVERGGFVGASLYKVMEGSPSNYAAFYEAADSESLKKYLDGPAKELREDYNLRFGSKSKLRREILEAVFAM